MILPLERLCINEGGINFLANKKTGASKDILQSSLVMLAAVGILIFSIGLCLNINAKRLESQKQYTALKRSYKRLLPEMNSLKENIKLKHFLIQRPEWGSFLKGLSHQVLPGLYVVKIEMDNNEVNLRGVISREADIDNDMVLSDFIRGLQGDVCSNVSLIEATKDPDNLNRSEFEISCNVN